MPLTNGSGMWAVLLACLAAGCGAPEPEPPAVYPATGRITFKGGRPFAGGVVTFTSKSDPTRTLESPVADDGAFELAMMFGNRRLGGAAEGAYEVMVSSRFDARRGVEIYQLPDTYHVRPGENTFRLEVDPSTARR